MAVRKGFDSGLAGKKAHDNDQLLFRLHIFKRMMKFFPCPPSKPVNLADEDAGTVIRCCGESVLLFF